MLDRRKSRLTFLEGPIEIVDPERESSLSIDLDAKERVRSGYPIDHPLPFSVWLTIEQVLDVAEDTDMRALGLELVSNKVAGSVQLRGKVSRLHEAAVDLRGIAARLNEDWSGSKGSS
jgi:hypothetical protein